ncbi:MAG: CFI-box-CTERM domain-containing protein [Clostridia bacterium]|nr:CFI-box-CTERM domain-containing protein [Clostridia bacterium]
MKQLTCEMCGGTDLVKDGGVFVCQTCGTKYSIEEAKKMMIEGSVDVSGSTVKVDNTGSIENYYKMAESAYESSNQKEAESYCNKIIEIDPQNYKAWFLKGKAAGWQSTLANIRIEESVNCFTKAVDNAPEEKVEEIKKDASKEIENLSGALMTLCCNNFAKYASKENVSSILSNLVLTQLYSMVLLSKCGVSADGFKKDIAIKISNAAMSAWNNKIVSDYFGSDGHSSKYAWERFIQQGDYVLNLLQVAINLCDDDASADVVRYKNMIKVQQRLIDSWSFTYSNGGWVLDCTLTDEAKKLRTDKIMEWHQKIKEIDPSYELPQRPEPYRPNGGCYVATAVYGSYDCPEVWTLRRFRDYDLAETRHGRAFIRTYYAISPTLVRWFGHTEWFKKMWRGKLDRMVERLREKGYESTPYEDRDWK